MKKSISIIILILSFSLFAQRKHILPISTPIGSLDIKYININGIEKYFYIRDNTELNGSFDILIMKKPNNIDYTYNDTSKVAFFGIETEFTSEGFFKNGYKNGLWKTTYKNKLVKIENWKNGLMVGRYRVYNTKGKLLYKTTFGSKGNGKFKDYYYKTGVLKQEGNYENGKKEGEWCDYYNDGTLSKIVLYSKGTPIK